MGNPVHVMAQRPQLLAIIPGAQALGHNIQQVSNNVRAGLNQMADDSTQVNHGGEKAPGAAASPDLRIPATTESEKKLLSAYNGLLDAFYKNKITGDMLASNKMLALQLEQALQWEQRFFQLMSNLAKLQHETMQGIIGNLRG